MRKTILLAAVCAVVAAAALSASAEVIKSGTYRMEWRAAKTGGITSGDRSLGARPAQIDPGKLTSLKGVKSSRPYYAETGLLKIVLDESKGTGKGYDTAFIYPRYSAPGVARQVLKLPLRKVSYGDDFRHLKWDDAKGRKIQVPLGGGGRGAVTKPLTIRSVRILATNEPIEVNLTVAGEWYGTLKTDTGKLSIRLVDKSRNGIQGDKIGSPNGGDVIEILKPGRAMAAADFYGRMLTLGDAVSYDGRLYSVTVSKSGDKVTVQPYRGPTGKVRIAATDGHGHSTAWQYASLYGEPGSFLTTGGEIVVPQGRYRGLTVEATAPRDGAEERQVGFTIRGMKPIDVAANETLTINVGGPLKVEIEPGADRLTATRGQAKYIRFAFVFGDGGLGGASGMPDAQVKITDDQGKVVNSGKSGFG